MNRFKSFGDAVASVWGLGFVPSWFVLKPEIIHELTDLTGLFANLFAILASIFTVVWAGIRISEHLKRRKAWKKHKRL